MTPCAPPRARVRVPSPSPAPSSPALLVLAGALNLWALSRNGWANEYYAGAVRSMAASWHAFLYGSLDAGGVMTVDKPPLALWVQALSVRAFGWSSWSMLVPQALMGVASVGLVYDLVARRFGRAGGFVAGAVLALTPIAVAVSRHNNPDALLVLCVVGALWAWCAGWRTGACAGWCSRACSSGSASRPRWARRCWSCRRWRSRGCGRRRAHACAACSAVGSRCRRGRRVAAAGGADAGFVAAVDLGHVGQLDLVADHRLQRPRPARRPGRRARAAAWAAVGGGGLFGGDTGRAAAAQLRARRAGGLAARVRARRGRRAGRLLAAAPARPGDGLDPGRRRLRADRGGRLLAPPRASSTPTT